MALAVLVFCFTVSAIVGSMGQSFSVFLLPISQTLQLERGEIAAVYSASLLASGLASPLVGLLFDRLGPRIVYAVGASVAAAGYALGSGADSLLEIGLLYGGLAGIGGALTGGVPHAALVSRWFRENAGTAMGIVFSAGGLATALTSPVSQVLTDAMGWRATFIIYAIVIGCIVPIVLFMPWRQIMAGDPLVAHKPNAPLEPGRDPHVWTIGSAMRTPSFWGLFFVYFFTGGCTTALAVHMVSYLTVAGFDPLVAATAFGMSGLLTPFGMIGFGTLSDRIGRRRSAALSYSATGLAVLCLFLIGFFPSIILLVPAIFFFGISSGSRGPMVSAIALNMFAGHRVGGIYGAISLGGGLGSAFGTWFSGALMDWTGEPTAILWYTGTALFIGALPFFTIGGIRHS